MMDPLITILLIAGGLIFVGIVLYNRLVALRESRKNAFADIDVQLKLRHDLVPNLVETVKGYATHEKELFENVTKARAQAEQAETVNDKIVAEGAFGKALYNVFAVAENYPDLHASDNFQRLQSELSDIENKISSARRFFNNATNELNTAAQQFPSNILARMFGFSQEPFFELADQERKHIESAPEVKFN